MGLATMRPSRCAVAGFRVTLSGMTGRLNELMQRTPAGPKEELMRAGLEIGGEPHGTHQATPGELNAIDAAMEQVARCQIASEEEVKVAFVKFRDV